MKYFIQFELFYNNFNYKEKKIYLHCVSGILVLVLIMLDIKINKVSIIYIYIYCGSPHIKVKRKEFPNR